MNKLNEFSDSFNRYVSPKISFLNNEYVNAFLMIIIIAYASLAAPRLPENIVRILDHPLAKFVVFFLIVYLAKYNAGVAIVAAVAVSITLMTLNKYNMRREMMGNMSTMEYNLDKCNGWDCEKVVQPDGVQMTYDIEGNESEFTESGHPVDFSNENINLTNMNLGEVQQVPAEHPHVEQPHNEQAHNEQAHNEQAHNEQPHNELLPHNEIQQNSNIITSSIKNLLKKAHIIEGYENSSSSSYSEF